MLHLWSLTDACSLSRHHLVAFGTGLIRLPHATYTRIFGKFRSKYALWTSCQGSSGQALRGREPRLGGHGHTVAGKRPHQRRWRFHMVTLILDPTRTRGCQSLRIKLSRSGKRHVQRGRFPLDVKVRHSLVDVWMQSSASGTPANHLARSCALVFGLPRAETAAPICDVFGAHCVPQ